MPVAKDAIFHSINDGVIVLDESYRLIQFDPACNKIIPPLTRFMFGMRFAKVKTCGNRAAIPVTWESVVKR